MEDKIMDAKVKEYESNHIRNDEAKTKLEKRTAVILEFMGKLQTTELSNNQKIKAFRELY